MGNIQKKDFWNQRAQLGVYAGTNDLVAKELEINAIASYVQSGMSILDFGCGNGTTAIEIAKKNEIELLGIDFAQDMIANASTTARLTSLKGQVDFCVGNHRSLSKLNTKFDLIYSERALINLDSWEEQLEAIINITQLLKPKSKYIMCENSADGLKQINSFRTCLDLDPIIAPWHNCYFTDHDVTSAHIPNCSLVDVVSFSSSYYFISRVLNAALARQDKREPKYDDFINLLALKLPSIDICSQVKLWIWEKQ